MEEGYGRFAGGLSEGFPRSSLPVTFLLAFFTSSPFSRREKGEFGGGEGRSCKEWQMRVGILVKYKGSYYVSGL